MVIKEFYRDNSVRYGIPVTVKELKELKCKFPFISISKSDEEKYINKAEDDQYIGVVMGINKEAIESILNGSSNVVDCWFINSDVMRVYKTKNDSFNFCELRNLARNNIVTKFARKGWSSKNMFIVYVPGSEVEIRKNSPYWNAGLRGKVRIESHFDMHTAQGTMQPGWVYNQTDIDADDWVIVE